jgi:hypothetical protein
MRNSYLREIVEIVGIISIVASLLLVAWEIRQSNRIATAKIEMQLAQGFKEMSISRATEPAFAKLFPKLSSPGSHLVTATEASQLNGLASHVMQLYFAAQIAHDNGLLSAQRLDMYRLDLQLRLDRLPGLHSALLEIYDSSPEMSAMPVFQPLRDIDSDEVPASADGPLRPE